MCTQVNACSTKALKEQYNSFPLILLCADAPNNTLIPIARWTMSSNTLPVKWEFFTWLGIDLLAADMTWLLSNTHVHSSHCSPSLRNILNLMNFNLLLVKCFCQIEFNFRMQIRIERRSPDQLPCPFLLIFFQLRNKWYANCNIQMVNAFNTKLIINIVWRFKWCDQVLQRRHSCRFLVCIRSDAGWTRDDEDDTLQFKSRATDCVSSNSISIVYFVISFYLCQSTELESNSHDKNIPVKIVALNRQIQFDGVRCERHILSCIMDSDIVWTATADDDADKYDSVFSLPSAISWLKFFERILSRDA